MSRLHFLDVGANVGQTFDDYLRHHGEFDGCELWCFEPSPRHLPALMENMGKLAERYRVHICPFGLAGRTGVRSFSPKDDPRGDSFEVRQARTAPIALGYSLEVAAVGVVDFILSMTSPEDRIVLKLDCEGAEYEILQALLGKEEGRPAVALCAMARQEEEGRPAVALCARARQEEEGRPAVALCARARQEEEGRPAVALCARARQEEEGNHVSTESRLTVADAAAAEALRRTEVILVEFHAPYLGAEMVAASGPWMNRAQLVEAYERMGKPIGAWLW